MTNSERKPRQNFQLI